MALGSLLVAWVPFLFVGAAGGAVVAGVFGLLALRAMRHTGGHGRRFAVAGVVIAPLALALCVVGALLTVKVVREVERFTQPGRYALVQNLPCSVSGTTVTLTGTIRNLENDPREYSLTVDFLSGSSVEKKVTVDIDPVAPQFESGWISTAFVTGSNITCRVSNVTGPRPFDLPTP